MSVWDIVFEGHEDHPVRDIKESVGHVNVGFRSIISAGSSRMVTEVWVRHFWLRRSRLNRLTETDNERLPWWPSG